MFRPKGRKRSTWLTCLKCGKKFDYLDAGHRFCGRCTKNRANLELSPLEEREINRRSRRTSLAYNPYEEGGD